jgi:hypothetical protein
MKGTELMRAVAGADAVAWRAIAGLDLSGVTADSRKAGPGMLFAAARSSAMPWRVGPPRCWRLPARIGRPGYRRARC